MRDGIERFVTALSGEHVSPPAAGLSFAPASAIEAFAGCGVSGAEALAETCSRLDLDFAFVTATEPWASRAVHLLLTDGRAPVWVVDGPLWPVLKRHGVMEGLRLTAGRPGQLSDDLDRETDRAVLQAEAGGRLGAAAVVLCDDLASSGGPLVAPDYAFEELIPRMGQVVFACSDAGIPTLWHSDGDLRSLLPGAARAGFKGVHAGGGLGVERFEHVFWTARRHGLAVLGGLLSMQLAAGPVQAVSLGVSASLLAEARGLLLCDDGGIASPDEAAAFATALQSARGKER